LQFCTTSTKKKTTFSGLFLWLFLLSLTAQSARFARQVGAGRNTAPPPVEDKGVVLRALKKGEIEKKSFLR